MLVGLCSTVAWRLLSLDFGSVLAIDRTQGAFPPLGDFVVNYLRSICHAEWKLKAVQIITAIVLVVGACLRLRWLVAVGIMAALVFNLVVAHLIQPMFMMDLPLSLLVIAICFPFSWHRSFAGDDDPDHPAATWLLRSWFGYILLCYFLAGVSKLEFSWNWAAEVKLSEIYSFAKIVEFAEPPWFIESISGFFHRLFTEYPALDTASAMFALVLELAAPLALFVSGLRFVVPFLLFVFHAFLWLMCAMVFAESLIITFALGWIAFRSRAAPSASSSEVGIPARKGIACVACAAALALIPGLIKRSYPPFDCHRFFGWSYEKALPKYRESQYALGYRDSKTGIYRPVPNSYGGFRDYTLAVSASWALRNMVESPADQSVQVYDNMLLNDLVLSLRPYDSNKWLLGWLSMPDRFTCVGPKMPLQSLTKHLFLLKGEPAGAYSPDVFFEKKWSPIGDVKFNRKKIARLYRDAPGTGPPEGRNPPDR